MITRFVGIKQFRQNMAKISDQARKKKERLIVLRKNKPIFELRPIQAKDALFEFYKDIEKIGRASCRERV